MLLSSLLPIASFLSTIAATPVIKPRHCIDLDHNGVCDYCEQISANLYNCSEGSGWTVVMKSSETEKSATTVQVTHGELPAAADWSGLKGTAWDVAQTGTLGFTGGLASYSATGDKCRTGTIGDQVIWNCGDMTCNGSWVVCGFSMGPGFYGTDSVTILNSSTLTNLNDNVFMEPWSGDPQPSGGQTAYGMDMSNVVGINDTHGVVFAWEILRGAADGSHIDLGNAVASVTLGPDFPIATRKGPLLTGPDSIQLGLLAAMADDVYIYLYSIPQPANVVTVTRVLATDAVFDITQYQTMNSKGDWVNGIPTNADAASNYGMTTAQPGGFGCGVYGSVFYNAYLQKYTLICNYAMMWTKMYVSDTPWGPWSMEYGLLGPVSGYGSMAHPEFSPDGGKTIPWSQGPDVEMDVYTLAFT